MSTINTPTPAMIRDIAIANAHFDFAVATYGAGSVETLEAAIAQDAARTAAGVQMSTYVGEPLSPRGKRR